ncbi:multicopper oxidase domain-containing protein [Thiothrix lacustris]|uniref:multicopper oxidase domain-containing protein n=1 Tax=Thiothrix lacustris TaxID=525917 RepID=UPI0027E518B2|nr:multicopper oxidase domain-containing protein [Thiothrix lacustris]WMP19439.1 multicopper oxidase domain-containing protein [Thiothrix lacustris]
MKRRDFLRFGVSSAAMAGLAACNNGGSADASTNTSTTTTTVPETAPFNLETHQAPRIYSKNGVLEHKLDVKFANLTVNGIPLHYRTFNGAFPSHTLVARPGDSLKIHLVNNLPALSEEDLDHGDLDLNIPHGFNNTNLHVHGLNVSPEGNQDNVLLDIVPSEWTPEKIKGLAEEVLTEFHYDIKLPADHPSGTFWYHPHKHGSSMPQLASGMAGFIVIEGGEGDLADLPELKDAKTIDLSFCELIIGANGEVPYLDPINNKRYPLNALFEFQAMIQYTVNGLAINEGEDSATCTGSKPPFLKMRPGEVQRWRFAMMSHLQTCRFALEGHDIHVAAWDGLTDVALETYNDRDGLILGPGNRVDILVQASTTPGTYPFKMLVEQFGEFPLFITPGFCGGQPRPDMTAFNVVVEGEPVSMSLPTTLNPPQKRLPDIKPEEITRRRTINFEILGDVVFDWSTFKFIEDTRQYFISNLKFNTNRINETVLLGSVEEWEIVNLHAEHNSSLHINHPFHLHVNWLQVMEIHHADGTVEYPNNGRGRWMDNIDVPFRGKVVVRIRFEKFPGVTVFHCHVLAHEDEGMMYLVEVVDPTPVVANITAAAGGTLASTDATKRLTATFGAGAFAADTTVSYHYLLDIQNPAGNGQPGDLAGLERYFRLESANPLTGTATIEVNFPLELQHGEKYDPTTVQLYRSNGAGGWTTDGITTVSIGAAQGTKIPNNKLISTVTTLGDGDFAVLARLTSGALTSPTADAAH